MDLISAASDETDNVVKWEQEHPGLAPIDVNDDYLFPKLNAAYARLVVVASPTVAEIAARLRKAVFDCFAGERDRWANYNSVLIEFQNAARLMLGEDVGPASSL